MMGCVLLLALGRVIAVRYNDCGLYDGMLNKSNYWGFVCSLVQRSTTYCTVERVVRKCERERSENGGFLTAHLRLPSIIGQRHETAVSSYCTVRRWRVFCGVQYCTICPLWVLIEIETLFE